VLVNKRIDYQFFIAGDINIGSHVIIGANSVILPNVTVNIGARIGANSVVKNNLNEWTMYAGSPIKEIGSVNKDLILSNTEKYHDTISHN
jgi:galactoside O-acetyltransferase